MRFPSRFGQSTPAGSLEIQAWSSSARATARRFGAESALGSSVSSSARSVLGLVAAVLGAGSGVKVGAFPWTGGGQ